MFPSCFTQQRPLHLRRSNHSDRFLFQAVDWNRFWTGSQGGLLGSEADHFCFHGNTLSWFRKLTLLRVFPSGPIHRNRPTSTPNWASGTGTAATSRTRTRCVPDPEIVVPGFFDEDPVFGGRPGSGDFSHNTSGSSSPVTCRGTPTQNHYRCPRYGPEPEQGW